MPCALFWFHDARGWMLDGSGDGNAQASAAAAGTRVDHVIDNSGSDRQENLLTLQQTQHALL